MRDYIKGVVAGLVLVVGLMTIFNAGAYIHPSLDTAACVGSKEISKERFNWCTNYKYLNEEE